MRANRQAGPELREFRQKRRMTQRLLAEAARVSLGTIQKLERGGVGTGSQIEARIAKALGCSPDLLFEDPEPRSWLSGSEAAQLAGVARGTVQRAMERGELPFERPGPGRAPRYRIARGDLEAWVARSVLNN